MNPSLKSVFHGINAEYPGRVFGDFNEEELIGLIVYNIDGTLGGHRTVSGRARLLSRMFDLRFSSQRVVPEKYLPAHDISAEWEALAAARVKNSGGNLAEWKSRGSFAIVPFEISLALLAYCMDLIKSDETKYVLAWYQAERNLRKSDSVPGDKSLRRVLSEFGSNYDRRSCQARVLDEAFFAELRKFYPHVETRVQLPLASIPFTTGRHSVRNSLTRMTDHLLAACFVAIIILTGIRQSEARSMKTDALKKNGKNYTFTSGIDKTNYGVMTERDVVGIAADFVDILDGLGSFGLDHERRGDLFSYVRYVYHQETFSLYSLGVNAINVTMQVNSFYDVFLESQGHDVRRYCSHVTAHGFRHTWAEFAMRRFDGNIMPLIRDHYRHHFGSNMTQAYTHNKIELSEYQELGKRHIFEFVSRYIDGAAMLYGQMGEFLTRHADEINFVEMHDRSERDEAINRLIEEHVGDPTITPHEYGLCVLREDTKHLANCRDDAGIPQTETAEINNCAACVNSCMVKQADGKEDTHFETLKRLLAVYKAEAKQWEDNDLIGPLFVEGARKTHRAIKAVVDKMENSGD